MSRQFWSETISWSTASGAAITNTTTETILFPNITIPANYLQDGRTLRLTLRGQISNVVTAVPTITFRLRFGGVSGTILAQTAALSCSASAFTNAQFMMKAEFTVRANGATGSILAMGNVDASNLSTSGYNPMGSAGALSPAAVTADLTANTDLAVTAQWSAANASNSIQGLSYIVEALN